MFKEGICPCCHEKIQVPEDRNQIICMFCGKEISVEEALEKQKSKIRKVSQEEYDQYMDTAKAGLEKLSRECDNPMQNFRKNLYEGAFNDFCSINRPLFEAVDMICGNAEDADGVTTELTDHLINAAKEELAGVKFKGHKNQKQMDYNFLLSIYLVPSAVKYPGEYSEQFADHLLADWNQAFGTNLGKATYEGIAGGFRRKLCYVTTAVCEGLGKGTDCYELNVLKRYRDEYLEHAKGGHELVEEYYDIAPTIVKRMEKEADKEQIYRALYEDYLMPCIRKIEAQEYEECRDLYESMVETLKVKYLM